jgi:hypothetical protein
LRKQNLHPLLGAGFFMHPWTGRKFKERKERAEDMRAWLKANPDRRIKNGTTREDGLIFCGYGAGYANGEHWAPKAVFEKRMEASRNQMRQLRQTQSYRDGFNAYAKKRYAERADVRLKMKERTDKWSAENKPRRAQSSSARRALKRSQLHPAHDFVAEAAMHDEARQLTLATGIEHHVDHIIPIKHGGWHHHQNMQVLPEPVNLGKSSDPFWLSEDYKDFKDVPSDLWPESLADFYLAQMTT